MGQQIVDLDAVVGPDKHVKLGGRVYRLPADLPVELYLRINRFASEDSEQIEANTIQALYEELLGLFRHGDPSIKSLPIGMTQLVGAIAQIYGGEQQPDPPRPTRRGGTKSSSSPTSRSRS